MNKLNQITFFCGNLTHTGGTERALVNLANALVSRGYSVNIISLCGAGSSFFNLNEEIEIEWLESKTLKSDIFRNLKKIRCICDRKKPDIWIDVDSILIFYSKLFHKRMKEAKFISWEHFNFNMKFDVNPTLRKISRRMVLNSNNTLVVLSEYDKSEFEKIANRKCDVKCILNSAEQTDFHIDYSTKTAVAVGNLVEGKNFEALIEIWKSLGKDDWNLIIYGNGPERESLEKYILDSGLEMAKLPGISSSKKEMYGKASLFLMTSQQEGLSMAMIEAMESGLGIISFDCGGGIGENIVDGENGFIIAKNDTEAYKEKLKMVLENKELRENMGKASKAMASKYSIDAIEKEWESLFEKLQ